MKENVKGGMEILSYPMKCVYITVSKLSPIAIFSYRNILVALQFLTFCVHSELRSLWK